MAESGKEDVTISIIINIHNADTELYQRVGAGYRVYKIP